MEFNLKDVYMIVGLVIATVSTFYTTRHKLGNQIVETEKTLRSELHRLELKLSEFKTKDELQQQIINVIDKQMNALLPKLLKALNSRDDKL